MKASWSGLAQRDFLEIVERLLDQKPFATERIVERIDTAVLLLETQPYMGRMGRVDGTRELVIPSTPYIAVYRVEEKSIVIMRLLDARRLWPKTFG